MDVIHLWEWASEKLKDLPSHIDYSRQAFPGKPVILGCFLRDFLSRTGISLETLKFQWKQLLKMLDGGMVQGYSIFGGFLIEMHPEQASWVRSFIAAN
jgi:hypothetical protein